MNIDDLTYQIIGAFYKVHSTLGPGLLESIYEAAMIIELTNRGLEVRKQVPLTITYEGATLPVDYRLDLLVEDTIIIELKSVSQLTDLHFKQLLTYLKISGKPIGYLVNFNVSNMQRGFHRLINTPILSTENPCNP